MSPAIVLLAQCVVHCESVLEACVYFSHQPFTLCRLNLGLYIHEDQLQVATYFRVVVTISL